MTLSDLFHLSTSHSNMVRFKNIHIIEKKVSSLLNVVVDPN